MLGFAQQERKRKGANTCGCSSPELDPMKTSAPAVGAAAAAAAVAQFARSGGEDGRAAGG